MNGTSVTYQALRDPDLFGRFFNEYSTRIYRYIAAQLRSSEDAEEVTSTTFIKLWETVNRREGNIEHFSAFLYQIARNATVDFIRRRRSNSSLEELVEAGHDPTAASASQINDALEDRDFLIRSLNRLRGADRDLLIWRFISGYAVGEIASMLKISENAASVRIFRALSRMRKILASH